MFAILCMQNMFGLISNIIVQYCELGKLFVDEQNSSGTCIYTYREYINAK